MSGIAAPPVATRVPPDFPLTTAEIIAHRTPNYCEENVYRLLTRFASCGHPPTHLFAIFLSTPQRRTPLRFQKAAHHTAHALCVWDYHVLAAVITLTTPTHAWIYDVDSSLPLPCTLSDYCRAALHGALPAPAAAAAQQHDCRVVRYDELRARFASDRRHMRAQAGGEGGEGGEGDAGSGTFCSAPPREPCIAAAATQHVHTLPLFLRMSEACAGDALAVPPELCGEALPGVLVRGAAALLGYFRGVCARLDAEKERAATRGSRTR